MMKRVMAVTLAAAMASPAAELPVRKVVLYKNGVAYYERSGAVPSGETARLEFKASEMDDVLKSLVVEDRGGGGVRQVRYELSESLEKKLADAGVQWRPQEPLALLLDQWRGSRIELRFGGETLAGTIVSGRMAALPQQGQRQELTVLLDSGELRMVPIEEATGLKLTEARLQQQLKDALLAMAQSRSVEKRSVSIDTAGTGARTLSAHYLLPAPVWKSSYRLTLPDADEPVLEGWAIVDNASGEDWSNVELTVVSGRPVSFISRLYEPRYTRRQVASLPEDEAAAPLLYEGALQKAEEQQVAMDAAEALGRADARRSLASRPAPPPPVAAQMKMSSVAAATVGREAGDLFEYRFASPVTARKGESLLLPFVQQKIGARKLLVYSDRSNPNPRAAAEITNSTGKTLDGGPITVYQSGAYAGEALMETLKAGDKRLISYAVDLGTRVTTNFESGTETVRQVTARRGILTARSAVEVTTTYTISNVDARAKTLVVEHPVNPSMKLVKPKADETTPNQHRFTVALPANGLQKLAVVEEREVQSSVQVVSMTPEMLGVYIQNRTLSTAARKQLEEIAVKKRDLAAADRDLRLVSGDIAEITKDQERIRQNLASLNRVAGQQEQVQRYANELAQGDMRMAQLRDRHAELQKRRAALEAEVNSLIEKLEF